MRFTSCCGEANPFGFAIWGFLRPHPVPGKPQAATWTKESPAVPGIYLWTDPVGGRTGLFRVVPRFDGKLIVADNPEPVAKYFGLWLGPFPDSCTIVTPRSPHFDKEDLLDRCREQAVATEP